MATNVRTKKLGQFIDIIKDEEGVDDEKSKANFSTVLLETKSASDLFRSDNSFLGRPNVILKTPLRRKRVHCHIFRANKPRGIKG